MRLLWKGHLIPKGVDPRVKNHCLWLKLNHTSLCLTLPLVKESFNVAHIYQLLTVQVSRFQSAVHIGVI